MAQYPIPQFIEQEGKIIFFLTFRQFFMLVGGGALCALYFVLLPFYFFVMGSMITLAITAIIAFIKIDGFPVITTILNFAGFSVASKSYMWQKKEASYPFKIQKKPELGELQNTPTTAPVKMQTSKLNDIKKLIETKK